MIPTQRTVLLLFLPAACALFALVDRYLLRGDPGPQVYFLLCGSSAAAILLFFLLDSLLIPGPGKFHVERNTDPIFSVHFRHPFELVLHCKKTWISGLLAELRDDQFPEFEHEQEQYTFRTQSGRLRFNSKLAIHKRGLYRPEHAYLTVYSPLKLGRRIYRLPCPSEIRVYPDLKRINEYVLLARQSHQGLLGIRRVQKAGGDTEFESLREYEPDDEFRHIDWKSSARNSRLIVRSYQMNKNQTVIFMIDCGRMLTAETNGQSLLDHTLSSVLLLARVALEQGDNVGLIAFGANVIRYVKPGHSTSYHKRLTQALYDIYPRHEESNFDLAFHFLHQFCRKRSLVMLLTNVVDEMNAAMVTSYMKSIGRRHLPFSVLLKMPEVEHLLAGPPANHTELYTQAAAADFLNWRGQVLDRLKGKGALAVELSPEQMSLALINQYLWIKARKLL